MKIGMSSACLYPNVNAEDSVKVMKDMGFAQGELFLNTFSEYEEAFVLNIKEKCVENDFYVNSVHICSSMVEPFLFDSYTRRRNDMMKVFNKVCKAISLLGGNKIYTFHGMRKVEASQLDYDLIIDMYNRLTYCAQENGVKLAQENVSWCMSSDIRYLEMLRERVRYPLYYTLDLKQSYKANVEPEQYIDVMEDRLCNFHINDKSEYESCMLPGKGDIDYNKIFKRLIDIKYKGMAIIEVYSDNYSSYSEINESKNYLDKLIRSL
jgi:sugar phosphate isomerase/epimerase